MLRINECIRRCLAKVLAPVVWTSLQINVNNVSGTHCDSGNRGVSLILGMGSYTGGYLQIGKTELDVKGRWLLFDGAVPHASTPFEGYRISVVAFCPALVCSKLAPVL